MQLYGHRGARGEAPENTLGGFSHLLALGIDHVELDLQLARDGELMVIHDDSVDRTTDGQGRVADLDSTALARLDASRALPGWERPEPVPTLRAVLRACPGMRHWQLEAKPVSVAQHRLLAERLVALFREFALHTRATVTSFDSGLLAMLRRIDATIPRGLVCDRARPDPVASARALGAGMLVLERRLCTSARITAAHAAGLVVSAWTVNDPEEASLLRARGIDSVITDHPSHLLAAL